MRRFVVLVVVLLMVGCGEGVGETAVTPTMGVVVEEQSPTETATIIELTAPEPTTAQTPLPTTPTPTKFVIPFVPTNTPYPTRTPSPMPPTNTPTPPLVWNDVLEFKGLIDSDVVYWSPTVNEFVVYCPLPMTTASEQDNTIKLFSAPEFQSIEISPQSMVCPPPLAGSALVWHPTGNQMVFSANSTSEEYFSDYSFLWLMSKDGEIIQQTDHSVRFLNFGGWMTEQNLVFGSYAGGGHWVISIYDTKLDEILMRAGIHAGSVLDVNNKYAVTGTGADLRFEYSAAVISETPIPQLEPNRFDGPYIRYLSFDRTDSGINTKFNSAPIDWLSAMNQLLVLTWAADVNLSDVDMQHDSPVTDLQLWDVETDALTLLVPGAVNGRFSPNGRFLTFLTPGNPAPYLQLLNRIDGSVVFAVQTLATDIAYAYPITNASFSPDSNYLAFLTPGNLELDENSLPSVVNFEPDNPQLHILDLETLQVIQSIPALDEALLWSPNGQRLIYRMLDDNLAMFDVQNGRFTPITLSGGARLSNPQWSFDGSYLSVQVAGEGVAVLQVP